MMSHMNGANLPRPVMGPEVEKKTPTTNYILYGGIIVGALGLLWLTVRK